MRFCNVNVAPNHLLGCVAENLLWTEHVSVINQVVNGKCMIQQVREGNLRQITLPAFSVSSAVHYMSSRHRRESGELRRAWEQLP